MVMQGQLIMQMKNNCILISLKNQQHSKFSAERTQRRPCGGEVARQTSHTHTVTHTVGGQCGGPAHALPSGRAWAGSSRYIWRGFLAGRTCNPELKNRQDVQANNVGTPAEGVDQTHTQKAARKHACRGQTYEKTQREFRPILNSQMTDHHLNEGSEVDQI